VKTATGFFFVRIIIAGDSEHSAALVDSAGHRTKFKAT
jgi:hypothetical protein